MDVTRWARLGAWVVGVGRVLTGVVLLAAPGRLARGWLGTNDDRGVYMMRAVGGRDLAIGAGMVWSVATDRTPVPWLLASVAGDAADTAGALRFPSPTSRRAALIGGGYGLLGVAVIAGLRGRT